MIQTIIPNATKWEHQTHLIVTDTRHGIHSIEHRPDIDSYMYKTHPEKLKKKKEKKKRGHENQSDRQ